MVFSLFRFMVSINLKYYWKISTTNIKLTHESSTENIPFRETETDLHIKPTDRHQYPHYYSSHSAHTKQSIVYSQTLRESRICSHEADFRKHSTEMKSWFLNGVIIVM